MSKKILIVGGVAGGASAAARLRRLDEQAEIVLFERDEHISFANCGLPYYIGDTITDRSKLLVQTPQAMKQRFNIDVRIFSEVVAIHSDTKSITVRSKDRGDYEESYDYLVLSPGAKPLMPPIEGIHHPKITSLRNIADTDRMKALVNEQTIQHAVVVGGGFIGIEMAENLRELNIDVTVVEAAPHILAPYDTDMIAYAEQELMNHGIQLELGNAVASFEHLKQEDNNNEQINVHLKNGTAITTDLVILAIGVQPDTAFLKESNIALGTRGHILVNDAMETNIANIYAVGDAIEVTHFVSNTATAIPLAGPANKQGRIVADNIAGLSSTYKGTQGSSIIKLFDLTGAATGLNERALQQLAIPYHVIHLHPASHATYYPDASPIALKVIFDEQGKLLGAQAFGKDGVDKRIDVIATAIRFGASVTDLTELELCYAPPYSSAKDPVNMAGYIGHNILADRLRVFVANELAERPIDETVLVDVRTKEEHDRGHIAGSISIPVDELRDRLDELDKNKEIWVYCQVGLRGYTASRILSQHGFNVRNLTGGYKSYTMSSL
ncbi:CoA-disulfide reductase [Paenibacillus yanchengensis]|uniref:CoA-disulfide reductase n=1 Tax=Paenibacillus yanchengensis TaxID=2035833 RepID=A0ABW4YG89_9BACL